MKKFYLKGLVFIMLAAGFVSGLTAQGYTGPGGGGAGDQPVSIKQAKTLGDHARVVLEGKIERAVGKKRYILNDGTDTVYVEIDKHHWDNLTVGPNDVVIIYGEVDREWNRIEIETRRIVKK
ncbi:MAG: NirD/YgiW/YdeI family stress tolerance protein [Treponema sp.]|jgi:uncharacterized protein (TIGR00156 family)|nr:NirD/YgiW/YdeI family stress tolerance protein [Treponema sp.]